MNYVCKYHKFNYFFNNFMFTKYISILFIVVTIISCKSKSVITDANFNNKKNKNNDNSNNIVNKTKTSYTYKTELSNEEKKYFAEKLNVDKSEITYENLYIFIKSWEETTYLWGGETKNGVDCSALMQHLFRYLYNVDLPRVSADMAFDRRIKFFKSMNKLEEGDLVFFRINEDRVISHVGVYLKNKMFFSAVSSEGCSIASLDKPYWKSTFAGGGRLKK